MDAKPAWLDDAIRELDRLDDARLEGALERLCESLKQPPNLDAVRWLALGMAIANEKFSKRLFLEVGLRAFDYAEQAAIYAELKDWPRFMSELGFELKSGERVSDAVLRILRSEDEEAWDKRNDRVATLLREISSLLGRLGTLARVKQRALPKEEAEDENWYPSI